MNPSQTKPKPSISVYDARRELWFRGILNYKLRPYQKDLETKFQEVRAKNGLLMVGDCARRWGKSSWLVKKCIEYARDPSIKHAKVKYGAAFLTDLEEIVIPIFQQMLGDCPKVLQPKWIATKKKYVFPHQIGGKWTHEKGPEVKLVGLDKNPDGIRGGYADFIGLEETQNISRLGYLYSSVLLPMTMKRPKPMIAMIGTPGESTSNEFFTFIQKAIQEDAYIQRNIYTNTYLTPADIERYHKECLSESDWLREYMCQWVLDEKRALVPEFTDANIKEVARDENFPYYHKYESMDIGGTKQDKTVILFAYRDFVRAKTVVTHEAVISGASTTTKAIGSHVKLTEQEAFGDYKVYKRIADNNNSILLADLRANREKNDFNLPFMETNKDELHAMVNQVRINIQDYEIHPRCKELIGNLKTGLWDKNRLQFDHSDIYGHFDAFAALVYLERNLDKHTNPLPRIFNPNKWYTQGFKQNQSVAAPGLTQMLKAKPMKRR